MEEVNIYGQNGLRILKHERTTARSIIIKDGKILLIHEHKIDRWMIPGGGLEENETPEEACVREVSEECGLEIRITKCVGKIIEHYEDLKFPGYYFICEPIGITSRNNTIVEKEAKAEPEWVTIEEALNIFSKYETFSEADEVKRGIYLREYTALTKLAKL